jgi:hypothetical protein
VQELCWEDKCEGESKQEERKITTTTTIIIVESVWCVK